MAASYLESRKTEKFSLHRRVVAYKTSSSWRQVPHVSYLYEPDVTDFYEEFTKLAWETAHKELKITFNTIMIKVILEGLLSAPELNATIEYNHKNADGRVHILREINISIPWLLPDGRLITPAILHSESMSLNDISIYMANLSKRIGKTDIDEMFYKAAFADAVQELKKWNLSVLRRIFASGSGGMERLKGKEKKAYYSTPQNERLSEKDIMNGTVTISNIGSLYKGQRGAFGLLEIIPPQVFAVGIGAIQEKPGVYQKNGKKDIGIRKILPMCLVFDHRAIDFSSLVPFLKRLDGIFADPCIIHQW